MSPLHFPGLRVEFGLISSLLILGLTLLPAQPHPAVESGDGSGNFPSFLKLNWDRSSWKKKELWGDQIVASWFLSGIYREDGAKLFPRARSDRKNVGFKLRVGLV